MTLSKRVIRVLLVAEERDVLDAGAQALRRRGFEAFTASHGRRAVEWLENYTADVVVLDLKMPGIDGDPVLHQIQHRWPWLPVILLTDHGESQQAGRTSRDGSFDSLAKACDIEDLVEQVRRAARDHGPTLSPHVPGPIHVLLVQAPDRGPVQTPAELSRWGMVVYECHRAAEAHRALRQRPVDVVLIDVTWLGIRGYGLQQAAARQALRPAVIVLTNHRTMSRAVELLRNGASDLLLRPIDAAMLAGHIRAAHTRRTVRALAAQACRRARATTAGPAAPSPSDAGAKDHAASRSPRSALDGRALLERLRRDDGMAMLD
jgi:DNA-binding NtrC family response regulator